MLCGSHPSASFKFISEELEKSLEFKFLLTAFHRMNISSKWTPKCILFMTEVL